MSMIWNVLIALAAVALTGCDRTRDAMQAHQGAMCVKQDERIKRFEECMKLLPYGPDKTVYNDWAEVVSTCDDISISQASIWKPEGCRK